MTNSDQAPKSELLAILAALIDAGVAPNASATSDPTALPRRLAELNDRAANPAREDYRETWSGLARVGPQSGVHLKRGWLDDVRDDDVKMFELRRAECISRGFSRSDAVLLAAGAVLKRLDARSSERVRRSREAEARIEALNRQWWREEMADDD